MFIISMPQKSIFCAQCNIAEINTGYFESIRNALDSNFSFIWMHFSLILIKTDTKDVIGIRPKKQHFKDNRVADLYLSALKAIKDDNWKYFDIDHDIQNDNFNCGVFVIQFIERLINGKDLINLTLAHLYRKHVMNMLLDHSDPLRYDCPYGPHICTENDQQCLQCQRYISNKCCRKHIKTSNPLICHICTYLNDNNNS